MDKNLLALGVKGTPLKKIANPLGDVYHFLKKSEQSFEGFGEIYFSTVRFGAIKGWKKHLRMTMNLVVPVGEIKLYIWDEHKNEVCSILVGKDNYQRLTVPPGLWVAFEGISKDLNLLANFANLEHDPNEALSVSLDTFKL